MFFLKRLIMAAFLSKRQSNQTTDIEMEDCASYESFCCSIKATKKSSFSSFFFTGDSDSDSDDFNFVEDNSNGWDNNSDDIEWDDDNSDTEWTNDEQSCQDEIMDDLEIVFEEQSVGFQDDECGIRCRTEFQACAGKQSEMSAFIRKVNRDWNEANKDNNENRRSARKVSFAPDEVLVEVLPADICDRKGEWEMHAIDRLRFQKRIDETEAILSACLSKEHRSKISLMLQLDVGQKSDRDAK